MLSPLKQGLPIVPEKLPMISSPAFIAPMVLFTGDCQSCLYTNRWCREQLKLDAAAFSASPLMSWIHPDDQRVVQGMLDGKLNFSQARCRDKSGNWLDFTWRSRSLKGELFILGTLTHENDFPDQSLNLEADPNQPRLKEILSMMARVVENKNPGMRCSILLLDDNQEYIATGAGPSLPTKYNEMVEGLNIGPAVGSCGTAAFWNVPVVVENIFEDPLWAALRPAAEVAGVSSCWSNPITTLDGKVLGAMALYSNSPSTPEKHHLDGLAIAARMVGMAVERERLETQLRQAAKMEALGVLAGGVAHDFNNLLTAIMGNAELAMLQLEGNEKAGHMLHEIADACMKATELCNQMLAYAGRGSLRREHFDCNREIRELGELLRAAVSKKAQVIYDLDDRQPGVMGDHSQLRQIIMNLITNASEALGNLEGSITIQTDITELDGPQQESVLPSRGQFTVIKVSDTGCGMDEETISRIFDPFFTTKNNGRGLGLAAVQGIVQSHKGLITLDSAPGKGTTFTILLPFAPKVDVEQLADPALETSYGPQCVLVADDEDMVRSVYRGILRCGDYAVLEAVDGAQALDIFRKKNQDIACVLLDFSMPKLDGLEVFREMRKIDPGVKVILTSGYAESRFAAELKEAGFSRVMQKPVKMKEMLASLSEVIGSGQES